MFDYKLVEAFAAVIGEGGFEKAARLLHLSQGAVSQRVKLLEEQVGCILLVRSSPPKATAAGREMLKHFKQVNRLEHDLWTGLGQQRKGFATLPVGINADSLATWFFPAVSNYLDTHEVLLDLVVDDQAQTHQLLRDGEVLGCVSDRSEPFQGCRVAYLGKQQYRLYCTPEYRAKWFNQGVTLDTLEKAPMLIFNRRDRMHEEHIQTVFGGMPRDFSGFYLPDSEQFAPIVATGRVCGMIPYQQACEYVERGELINLLPGHVYTVRLHWHCWNLDSAVLRSFSQALTAGARQELSKYA